MHNVVIGRLWLDQSGEMDIFNHKTKDNCHLKYAQYSYFSRETPRKVTGSVTDEEGNAHFLLQGTWDDHLEAAPVLEPEADERQQQTGPWKMLWEREREPGEPDDPAGKSSLVLRETCVFFPNVLRFIRVYRVRIWIHLRSCLYVFFHIQ